MKTKLEGLNCLVICLIVISSVSAGTNANKSTVTTFLEQLKQSEWELVWKDDFAGEKLDDSKWTLCKRGNPDWKNTMSDDPRLPAMGEKQWPFSQPFYFVPSMQIGGKWVNGSGPTNPAHYPLHFSFASTNLIIHQYVH